MRPIAAGLALVLMFAGCLQGGPVGDDSPDAEPAPPAIKEFPVALDHDHSDPSLHEASLGLSSVAHLTTALGALPAAPIFNMDTSGNLLAASLSGSAVPGNALAPPMSLWLVDISDPARPESLSVTGFPGGGVESVALSDDGGFAFLGTEFDGTVGIWTVDVSDPRQPQILAFTPQPTEGPHNIRYGVVGDRHFLFASVSHVATLAQAAAGTPQDPLPVLDLRVDILEFEPSNPSMPLATVSSYTAQDTEGIPEGPAIVHDAVFQVHPITGQPLLYVAHWDRGVRIVDLTDPENPVEVGKYTEPAPTNHLTIHTVKPHPTLIDGRHVTVATAQCAYTPQDICYVRILDTTDPANPVQVGTWTLPEEVHGAIYTTEIFDLADGRLYVPWAHAGVWVLDISTAERLLDPQPLGYFFSASDPPENLAGGDVPDANAVAVANGHIFVADIWTGLDVLALER